MLQIPNQFCSQQTAVNMALLAYNRALKLSRPGFNSALSLCFTGYLIASLYLDCVAIWTVNSSCFMAFF